MSGSAPINPAAIARQESLAATKQVIGQQIEAADCLEAEASDAFNSMAAARAQKRYERFRSIETRVPKDERADQQLDVEAIEATDQKKDEDLAQQFSRRNSELPSNVLQDLKDTLNDSFSEKEILDLVTKKFPDPTLTDDALDFLEQSTTGELRDKVSRARQMLNEEKLREITGGRNIDAAAKDYSARGFGGSPTDLRNLYRDITNSEKDHTSLFFLLSQKYPSYELLREITQFLLKGMSYDIKSKGPSIPQPLLIRLMKELKDLQSILWVYLFFKERQKMIRNLYQRQQLPYPETLSFEIMAKSFMKLVQDRFPSALKVRKETDVLQLSVDEERIIILSQYRDAVRGLSPRLYQTIKHKQDLLVAIIEALEQLEPKDNDLTPQQKEPGKQSSPGAGG